jgi:hypothetical protein
MLSPLKKYSAYLEDVNDSCASMRGSNCHNRFDHAVSIFFLEVRRVIGTLLEQMDKVTNSISPLGVANKMDSLIYSPAPIRVETSKLSSTLATSPSLVAKLLWVTISIINVDESALSSHHVKP